MIRSQTVIPALAIALALPLSGPAAAENVLRFTSLTGGAVTMDPHSFFLNANFVATRQVYESLVDIDSNLAVVPQLATAWKPLNSTTWQFDLRSGVRFHDGTPLTVKDVAFSIDRARAQTADPTFQAYVANIAAASTIDNHTIQITTVQPDPLLWMRLSHIAIMSKQWSEAHDVTTPADYIRAREETYASRHANGTGPFILEEFQPHGRYVLVRNPHWWGTAEYPHNLDRIIHIWDGDDERHVDALLDGEIDLLQHPLFAAHDLIRRTPGLKLVHRPKLLSLYFGLDQGSAELHSSNIKGKNPFKDRRVRQAMYQAIDIEAILRPLMGELLIPAGMVIAPGVNGYSPELDQRLPYDPAEAKALLLDAGYPDGFSVTLDCPIDWGDDEITTCRGAADQLGEVGIRVSINFLPNEEHTAKIYTKGASDLFLYAWEADPDSERVLRQLFYSESPDNLVGYADPRIDELIDKIGSEMVTYARDAYLEEAWRTVTEDLVYLPVRHSISLYAMREELDVPLDPWDVPRFRLARFKSPQADLR
jgi:peptide/nickel transport system substrate-binding protein